ncbi:cytochrome p450 [Colletotrichum musicola]|uniref:Cytochrome p450 n=1 Tax=Colletotrichum musicola TaxID=2175873 RepID=A0A8H6ISE7_9PEZI|nr:cytochrome p450 [Colletotrichum musicola]
MAPNMAHIHTWRDSTFALYLASASLLLALLWVSRSLEQARKRLAFLKNGMHILRAEREKNEGVPFHITTAISEATILPPEFIPSHRLTNIMSLGRAMVMSVARKQLTQHLKPLSAEAAFAAEKAFGSCPGILTCPSPIDVTSH